MISTNQYSNREQTRGPRTSQKTKYRFVLIVVLSAILGAGIGFALSYAVFQSTISEPYVHSQLLENEPPIPIQANSMVGGWVLNWTPTSNIRVAKIQVWMGNPNNVTWEGDTYVTIGKPNDPSNSSSYNNTIQLLVHYQFDSHAPSSQPHQLMFDLGDGFEVLSTQTINVWRDFNNIEPYTVYSGDVQVIIYYENV